ncbi:MAG: UDP-2,3-diacylglucosamine diphosphatase [Burkholderiales bacterium RIFCSPLOWO2_02_FULL_57_36]|nr:MAG: UDP-2,3-diacylglucosamine diphosphatase [Burkholderiales bacterium RIFCSPLOWO2_02_FULL_57_36]
MHNQRPTKRTSSTTAQRAPEAIFVSDIHLTESIPRTTQMFFAFLRGQALQARQLFLLGDLFEYWAGDDDIATPFNRRVAEALRQVTDAGVALFWIAGNRDFLIGEKFAHATGAMLLPDPFIATIGGRQVALSHGDAQCTDDTAYMAFRSQVREPRWQQSFLAQPLAQRKKIIEGMRTQSQDAQRDKPADIMDVNAEAIASLFDATGTSLMIHGHTHRPARHEHHNGEEKRVRYVLPDWDCDVVPERGGWISMYADGTIKRFQVDGTETN